MSGGNRAKQDKASDNSSSSLFSILSILFGKFYAKRLVASYLYYSGQVEQLRREQLRRGSPGFRILRYQQIADPKTLPLPVNRGSCIHPTVFERQLSFLAANYQVIPLSEILRCFKQGKAVPDRTLAITLDHGWKTHFTVALPLLKKYQLPATLCLPVSYIGTKRLYWEDQILLAMLMLKEADMPFPKLSVLSDQFYADMERHVRGSSITLEGIAHLVLTLSSLPYTDRLTALVFFERCLNDLGGPPALDAFMSWDEVRAAVAEGFSVAPLGYEHRSFAELKRDEVESDIRTAFDVLSKESVPPLSCIAPPYGTLTKEARGVLGELGVGFILALGQYTMPQGKGDKVAANDGTILGRLGVTEGNGYCKELLSCTLWGVEGCGCSF